MIDRRDFLLAGGARLGCVIPDGVAARAPMATTQVPGFYRFSIGQFQVTVLSDGRFTLTPNGMFPSPPADERSAALSQDFQAPDPGRHAGEYVAGEHRRSLGADRCWLGREVPSANTGFLLDNLAAAGMKPEDIDVVRPHAHGDHLWGVTARTIK